MANLRSGDKQWFYDYVRLFVYKDFYWPPDTYILFFYTLLTRRHSDPLRNKRCIKSPGESSCPSLTASCPRPESSWASPSSPWSTRCTSGGKNAPRPEKSWANGFLPSASGCWSEKMTSESNLNSNFLAPKPQQHFLKCLNKTRVPALSHWVRSLESTWSCLNILWTLTNQDLWLKFLWI